MTMNIIVAKLNSLLLSLLNLLLIIFVEINKACLSFVTVKLSA